MKTQKEPPKGKKSVIFSDAVEAPGEGQGEEAEVAAQVIVPAGGGWAWVVLASAFLCLFIVDGCVFSYGALLPDIVKSLKIDTSLGALISAVELTVYLLCSPISSGIINRFGFRTSCMTGSIISSIGLFCSFFSKSALSLIIFLGLITGFGNSLISISASLIVGFYFEKRRSLAIAICTGGSSVGVMIMYQVNNILVKIAGWQNTLLLHAGLHGLLYFLGLAFRPLLALTITETEEGEGNPTRTVTILPTVAGHSEKTGGVHATGTEKLLGTVSSKRFPTASAFFHEGISTDSSRPSTSARRNSVAMSKITLQAQGVVNKAQMKQVQSMVSRMQVQDGKSMITHPEITIKVKEEKPKSFFGRLFNWQADAGASRPIYRDDAFYDGKVEKLPIYQKSVASIKEEDRIGLEYQLAVSRAIKVEDLRERRGMCTTSLRRVLASMLDPSLLKRKSFLMVCLSGFLAYGGVLVPYIFLQSRNLEAGVDGAHCSLFVSVLSFSNFIGRFIFCLLSDYFDVCHLMICAPLVAGILAIFSDVSYSLVYQYAYVIAYGSCCSVISGLRSIVLVKLYGLENLTNCTGIVLMFLGFGNLFSTPLAATLKNNFGYKIAFSVSGAFLILSGVAYLPVNCLNERENKAKYNIKNKKYFTILLYLPDFAFTLLIGMLGQKRGMVV